MNGDRDNTAQNPKPTPNVPNKTYSNTGAKFRLKKEVNHDTGL